MGLFNRSKPTDTNALHAALTHGTLAELEEVYQPAWVNYRFESGTPLTLALTNKNTSERVAVANRLLDDGADIREGQPLHVLLGRNQHDFTAEARLLERMLDAGADVNEVMKKFGTPLETVAAKFKFSDVDLAPFYSVLLARPDLDLLRQSLDGRTVLDNLRRWADGRRELVILAERTLADRGTPVPRPEP